MCAFSSFLLCTGSESGSLSSVATGGWRGNGAARGRRNTAGESDTGGEGQGELRWEVDGRRQSLRRSITRYSFVVVVVVVAVFAWLPLPAPSFVARTKRRCFLCCGGRLVSAFFFPVDAVLSSYQQAVRLILAFTIPCRLAVWDVLWCACGGVEPPRGPARFCFEKRVRL